jgi:VCBS repeat-containing protein
MSLARVFSGFRPAPGRRLPPPVRSRHGADGSAGAGWAGGLSFVALILSALKEARAADPDVTLFDHGTITYKDFEHGSFELVTKEAVPRHIVVDDPGKTVVLTKIGSSVSFAQVANSAARMEDLQAQQQDVLANYEKEHGPRGSSTPPGEAPELVPQPINFIEPDGPVPQHSLPALVIPASSVPDTLFIHMPPTLTVASGPVEVDTVAFDQFSATSGSFSATSFGSGAAPILGIAGGEVGPVVIGGATYDVEKPGSYGILYLNSATGAYTYVPNNDAINALKAPTTDNFTITASDGLATASQTFTVDINGTDDASVISGTTTGTVAALAMTAVASAAAAHDAPTASGTLTDTDVDDPANTFTAVPCPKPSDQGYGSFTMTADGHWTYALDNGNCAVQALNVGESLTDSFIVKTVDGTAQTVTVTIEGSNDAAVVCGDTHGRVVEPSGSCDPPPSASGTLTDRDIDNPDNTFVAVTCPQTSNHGYGSFTMTACGTWTYLLDEGNPAVKALNACDTLTDTFTVTTIDGTAQMVTVTIQGADDAGLHDFHTQTNSSSFQFKDDADLQHSSANTPSADLSAAVGPLDSWHGSSSEGGEPHPADEAPDAFHFPGHGDVAFHASHHDLIV